MTEKVLWVDQDLVAQLKFDEKGLVPGIVQDAQTGAVLMVAWLNRESLEKTLETGYATFWSRSRQTLWMKGETSGNRIKVKRIHLDCDGDTLLLESEASGPACHTGERTCFFRLLAGRKGED